VLTTAPLAKKRYPSDLLASRIGGRAVLPVGARWPTFTVELRQQGQAKKEVWGTYIGTYDLRGCFGFKRFPAAISIFLCAYDETLGYGAMANAENPVGKIVPLHGESS
jgi:hypothetical protein